MVDKLDSVLDRDRATRTAGQTPAAASRGTSPRTGTAGPTRTAPSHPSRRAGSTTHARYWGIPVWSVFLIMIAAALTGALLCTLGSGVQGKRYFLCLALAGVICAAVVKVRGLLLTISLQPILFLILSPPAAMLSAKLTGTTINFKSRTALLSYVFPLTNAFPFLATAVVLSIVIAVVRVVMFTRNEKANPSVYPETPSATTTAAAQTGTSARDAAGRGAASDSLHGVRTAGATATAGVAGFASGSAVTDGPASVRPTTPATAGASDTATAGGSVRPGAGVSAAGSVRPGSGSPTAGSTARPGSGVVSNRPSTASSTVTANAGSSGSSRTAEPVRAPRRDPNERGIVPGTVQGAAAAAGRVGYSSQTPTPDGIGRPAAREGVREGGSRRADRRLGEPGARSVSDLQRAAARSNSQGTIGRTGGIVPESRRQRPGYTPGDAASRHEADDLRSSAAGSSYRSTRGAAGSSLGSSAGSAASGSSLGAGTSRGTGSSLGNASSSAAASDNYSSRGRFISSTSPSAFGSPGTRGVAGSSGSHGVAGSSGSRGVAGSAGSRGVAGSSGSRSVLGSAASTSGLHSSTPAGSAGFRESASSSGTRGSAASGSSAASTRSFVSPATPSTSSATSAASGSSSAGPALHRTSLADLGKESKHSDAGRAGDRVTPSWSRSPIPPSRHAAADPENAEQAGGSHRAAGDPSAALRAKEYIQPLGGAVEEHSPLPRHRHSAEPRD